MPEAIITVVHYTEGGFEKSFVKRSRRMQKWGNSEKQRESETDNGTNFGRRQQAVCLTASLIEQLQLSL